MFQSISRIAAVALFCAQAGSALANSGVQEVVAMNDVSALSFCPSIVWTAGSDAAGSSEKHDADLVNDFSIEFDTEDTSPVFVSVAIPSDFVGLPETVWGIPCDRGIALDVATAESPFVFHGSYNVVARNMPSDIIGFRQNVVASVDLTVGSAAPVLPGVLQSPALALLAVAFISIAAVSRREV